MRSSCMREARRHPTTLFQNKSEAIALKRLIKACFAPQFIYDQSPSTQSHKEENGPSFIGCSTAPREDREARLSLKAFVCKRLRQGVCEQVKRGMDAVKDQSAKIDYRIREAPLPVMSRASSVLKCNTPSTTNRSTVDPEPRRTIFRLPLSP